jgi:hypothetical protein
MFKTTFTYTKSVDVDWFEVHYATDAAVMELYNYQFDYFNSLPDCSLTVSDLSNTTVGTVIFIHPTEDLAPEFTSDPRIQELFEKVMEYYNTHDVDIDMVKEEI